MNQEELKRLGHKYWRTPNHKRDQDGGLDWRSSYHHTAHVIMLEKMEKLGSTYVPYDEIMEESYDESRRITERAINEYNENLIKKGRKT